MTDTPKHQIIDAIEAFNAACERVEHCYFWSGDNGNARIRSGKDKYYSDYREFVYQGRKYTCELVMDFRRHHVEKHIIITRDGTKTTRTVFKKILNSIKEN